ncbi:MAG TPA: polysaccharide biosynthesis tyrosine autokinase [bacterium]|nr:polysaccharide biosynthesis tyrosine autokinase [bacterium]
MAGKKPPPYATQKTSEEAPPQGLSLEERFHRSLHIIKKRKKIILGSVAVSLFIALFINYTQKPIYQSSARVIFEPKPQNGLDDTWSIMTLMYDPTFLFTQVNLTQNPSFGEKVLEKIENSDNRQALLDCFNIEPSPPEDKGMVFSDRERRSLKRAIQGEVSARQLDKGVGVIIISVTGYDPSILPAVTNAAADAYIDINYESSLQTFQKSFLTISRSLSDIQQKIKMGEIALKKTEEELQLFNALKVYEEKHPQVIRMREEISVLTEKLESGAPNLKRLEFSQGKNMMTLLLTPHVDVESLSAVEGDLSTIKPLLEQEISTNKEMYNSIFKKLQELEISGGNKGWLGLNTLGTASIPGRPIRPDRGKNLLLGLLTGLLFGIGMAYFLEYLDSSLKTLEDISTYLKLFPLGMIPQVEKSPQEKTQLSGKEPRPEIETLFPRWLVNDPDTPLYVIEAYKKIRTNLALGTGDKLFKVIQVTSAVKGEGKTTTVANLGISLAETGSRVLVVDADMRCPALAGLLGLEGVGSGLSDLLMNGSSCQDQVLQTRIPNLFCLPAGKIPGNPAELLSSERMKNLVAEFQAHYDRIIIDSPPTISVTDSSILASIVDGTIFIFRAGFIPRHLCLQSKKTIETVEGHIIGCILNGAHSQYHAYYLRYAQYDPFHSGTGFDEPASEKLRRAIFDLKKPAFRLWEKLTVLKGPAIASCAQTLSRWPQKFAKIWPLGFGPFKEKAAKEESKTLQP